MLNFISEKLQKSIAKIKAKNIVNESDVLEISREIKFILLEADVNFMVVKKFIKNVKDKVIGSDKIGGLDSSQFFTKIFNQELIKILGDKTKEITFEKKPKIILMVGLQGSGKTTTCAKIAKFFLKKKKIEKPLIVACDVHRPAAIDQLEVLGKQIQIDVFKNKLVKDAVFIAKEAMKYGQENNYDLLIFDTAGRLAIDEKLMQEVENIKKAINPTDILFVVDALSGQDMLNVVQEFNQRLPLNGTIITKLDSEAKGGIALSITSLLSIPILFVGDGEKINNFNIFHPDRMANRILGMGDVLSLIEKTQEAFDENQGKRTMNRLASGKFDLNDLMEQLKQMKKLGKMQNIIKMIPGLGKKISSSQIENAEKKFQIYSFLISSMTNKERKYPKLLKKKTIKDRIIKGSGRNAQEYNKLVNEFERMSKQMKEMTKKISSGNFNF